MTRAIFVKKARKDNEVVKKGESYWWWKFRFGSKHYSKTQPKQSQLTQSEFLSQIYELGERIEDMTIESDFESEIQEITGDLENLGSECEDKHSNMPDQLQDAPTGEMLQNRVDECESMASELEGIDIDVDEEGIKGDLEKEKDETDEEFQGRIDESIDERKEEILSEIQGVCYNGE